MTDILLYLAAIGRVIEAVSRILTVLQRENREPTREELLELKARRDEVEQAWADLAPPPIPLPGPDDD
jgi:hypothetical protein